jgi:hypothetical protein
LRCQRVKVNEPVCAEFVWRGDAAARKTAGQLWYLRTRR